MDYEKKYKEALEWARKVIQGKVGFVLDEVLEKFPELKENEDKRIKKKLIDLIYKVYINTSYITCVEHEEILAWLEKQGEKKPEVKYVYTKFRIGDVIVEIKPNGYCQPVRVKYVGEESYSCESDDGKRFLSFPIISQDEYELVSKKIEQKLADKVEPKFHKGEWVICKNGSHRVFQVIERSWPNAKYLDEKGFEGFLNVFTLDKQYRPWTIQDAKDGSVLRIRNLTFIFQEITNNNVCHKDAVVAYCSYEDNDDGFGVCGPDCITDLEIITPATKEQRDLLFQKMKEAGYEWDAEKKELKKIEQKPTDKVEPKFKVGDTVTVKPMSCHGKVFKGEPFKIVDIIEDNYVSDDGKAYSISLQDGWELVEQNPAWSEGDRKIIIELIGIFESAVDGGHVTFPYRLLKDYIRILKSCIPQRRWKPTEKQMYNLSEAAHYNCAFFDMEILKGLYDDLKQL